jgi:YD repeat-containing protein
MALPEGVTTCTVVAGVPVTHAGSPVKTFVSIEPSVFLVHTATGTPLVDFLEELDIAEGVAGQFSLPHTDQTGFQDENGNAYTNWYYTARISYRTPSGAKIKPPKNKVFQLATGQTNVDLDKLPGGAPALPYTAPIATVTSVAGQTGAVTGSQIAALPELTATYASAFPDSQAITYNPDGSVATVTENGVTTSYTYNGDGTVATDTRAGVTRTYTYTNGNLTGIEAA